MGISITFDKNIDKNDPIQNCLNSAIITDISTARKETISNHLMFGI